MKQRPALKSRNPKGFITKRNTHALFSCPLNLRSSTRIWRQPCIGTFESALSQMLPLSKLYQFLVWTHGCNRDCNRQAAINIDSDSDSDSFINHSRTSNRLRLRFEFISSPQWNYSSLFAGKKSKQSSRHCACTLPRSKKILSFN